MTTRLALTRDAQGIASTQVASWRAAYGPFVSAEALATLQEAEKERFWAQWIDQGKAPIWVTETDKGIIGYLVLSDVCHDADKDARQTAEIIALYVHPECWRLGVGTSLYRSCIGHLHSQKFTELVAWVVESNALARKFYEKMGFQHDGRREQGDVCGAPVTVLRYSRQVPEDINC